VIINDCFGEKLFNVSSYFLSSFLHIIFVKFAPHAPHALLSTCSVSHCVDRAVVCYVQGKRFLN